MEVLVIVITLGIAVALAAAVRSTWSPCGLSMLSQITPVAESGRGQKFAHTAAWFVAGAALGGLTLGTVIAVGAVAVAGLGVSAGAVTGVILVGALASAAVDARLFGFGPPFLRRQVNEDWLSNYRSWVYGGGFGWQIGAGVTTYVMTAAVPLLILIGVVSGRPWIGAALGVVFGLTRGLAVLLARPLRTPAALFAFHRRFDAWAEPVRRTVIGVQLAVAIAAAGILAQLPAVGVAGAALGLLAMARPGRADRRALAEIV